MATDTTDNDQQRPEPDWNARTIMLGAVAAFALCLAIILTFSRHEAAEPPAPTAAAASPQTSIRRYIPWTPSATENKDMNTAPPREGPYTIRPDVPLLPSNDAFISLLGDELAPDRYFISRHANNNSFQGGDWSPDNVVASSDGVRLDVTRTGNPAKPFALAEVQLSGIYGYGRYETIMRPAKGSGLVSAFFTYTGPYFGDPHEEIDIEFVGKSTDTIELNYFHKGNRGNFVSIKLPFDASEADHLYAFDWMPEGISWYVDGKLIYKTAEGDKNIPTKSGRIYFSNWTGVPTLRDWHGKPDFGERGSAYYSCISYTPLGENTRRCADVFKPGERFQAPAE